MMGTRTEAIPSAAKWHWSLQGVFEDLRVRYGIKVGLAALLALFATQELRLPHASWAVLTVLVMMSSQYVGSIAVKAIMRVIGTVAGALVGIWLVGNYTSTPVVFLTFLFFVVALATYKFGQFPASQVPYAYFLVGVTTLAVATNGVADPTDVWEIGLDRALEILVGAGSSLLVTALVWPRYAREEFVAAGRSALKTIRELIFLRTDLEQPGASARIGQIQQAFSRQLSVLRNLLQAGARESTVFSARLSNYNASLVSLTNLFHAAANVNELQQERPVLDHVRTELKALEYAILEELDVLAMPYRADEKLRLSQLNEAFAAFEKKVIEIRDEGVLIAAPIETAISFAGHFAALRSVRDFLNDLRSATEGLPRFGQPLPDAKPHWDFLPTIDWFWVKVAIKGGLAAVISVLLLRWINPPGPASIPLMAWTLTILGRPFLQVGGSGDLRAFQNAFRASIVLMGCVALLLLITPFLTNYTVMNTVLFFILFVYGFLTARIPGINFWMQVALIAISAFVGLDPEQPIPSQTIIDTFLGIIIGMAIATVVGRLIWPVLPQSVLRNNLLNVLGKTKALLRGDSHPEKIRTHLAILPVEALQAVPQIRVAGCSKEEKARLADLIHALQALVMRITGLVAHRNDVPEIVEGMVRPQFERLDVEFEQMLNAFSDCFRRGDCRTDLPTARGALAELDQVVEQIRERRVFANQGIEAPLRLLDLVDQYHGTADKLEECGRLLQTLEIYRYAGDFAL
jgi:p-hydroxybenzoic acid efflux pump subunit AaeB